MKRIAETLAVARYNLVERAVGKRPKHGPQTCAGDAELTCRYQAPNGHPAELYNTGNRRRPQARAASHDSVNAKRVYQLMKKHGLLLARHIGRRIPRAHDGTTITSCSNELWCSGALEFTC